MKTLGQLADRLGELFTLEELMRQVDLDLTKPMLPARREELKKEREVHSAARDALRAEELAATLHKP